MGDLIVVALVASLMFFMIKRGGCCGGHRHEGRDHKESQSCCHGEDKNVKNQK